MKKLRKEKIRVVHLNKHPVVCYGSIPLSPLKRQERKLVFRWAGQFVICDTMDEVREEAELLFTEDGVLSPAGAIAIAAYLVELHPRAPEGAIDYMTKFVTRYGGYPQFKPAMDIIQAYLLALKDKK